MSICLKNDAKILHLDSIKQVFLTIIYFYFYSCIILIIKYAICRHKCKRKQFFALNNFTFCQQ